MKTSSKFLVWVLSIVEGVLLFQMLWMVLPRLMTGQQMTIELPLLRTSSGINSRHLLQFWGVLAGYLLLRIFSGKTGWLSLWSRKQSAVIQGVCLFAVVVVTYLHAGLLQPVSGDTVPAKLLPISVLVEHDLDLDEFYAGLAEEHRYSIIQKDGHWYPAYPIFPGLTALPIYAAVAWLYPQGFESWRLTYSLPDGDRRYHLPRVLEHYSASVLAALSVVVVWSILRLHFGRGALTLWLTAGYAFGTSILSTASWALWMHGPSCLFLALTVYWFQQRWLLPKYGLFVAGLCAGWAVACRYPNMIPVVLWGLWVLIRYRGMAWRFGMSCASVLAGVAAVNYVIYQQIFGGYSGQASLFSSFDPIVLLTVLFSPSRGLFLFSPFLLVVAYYAVQGVKRRPLDLPAFCLYGAAALCLLYASWGPWAGGYSFGPRLLTEVMLLLIMALPARPTRSLRHPVSRTLLVVLVIFACHVHLLGTFKGDYDWTARQFTAEDYQTFWKFRNSQLVWTLYGPSQEE